MTRPLLSFITSCKGRLRHLKRTFRSVVNQGGEHGEYVLVDYDDPDHSGDWVDDQQKPNTWVARYTPTLTKDFNQPIARNIGAAAAKGLYFCFIDCDTAVGPGFFERVKPFLAPGVALIPSGRDKHHGGFFVVHCDDFEKIGGFDETYDGYGCDDTDFLVTLDRGGMTIKVISASDIEAISHPGSDRIRFIRGSLQEAHARNKKRFRQKWGFPSGPLITHELKSWPHPAGAEFLPPRGKAGLPNQLVERMFRHIEAGADSGGSNMAAHMPMLHVLATQSPGPIVECGASRGYSTMAFLSGSLPNGIHMVSYDPNPECERWVRDRAGPELNTPAGKSLWKMIRKLSWEATEDWEDGTVGLFFLDTSHTRENTIRELDIWLPKMMPNGIMCGHDYWIHAQPDGASFDVKGPVDAFARKHRDRFDLQVFPHDYGFFILWPRT